MGVMEVMGATPEISTSDSCSTKASMSLISPLRCSTSSSLTAMRARWAIRLTVMASTDMRLSRLHKLLTCGAGTDRTAGPQTRAVSGHMEAFPAPPQPGLAVCDALLPPQPDNFYLASASRPVRLCCLILLNHKPESVRRI